MKSQRNNPDMIDLLICPGFCVKDNCITQINDAANRLFLKIGMAVPSLLLTGQEEYSRFASGCLYLQILAAGTAHGAVVTAMGDYQVFLVDDDRELRELQVLALAAQELRTPLSNIMISAERIRPSLDDSASADHQNRLNRGASQLLRLVSNMSDALRYAQGASPETRNVTALMDEIFEKAQALMEKSGLTLHYSGPREDIFLLADGEQLERAVYNLLSNAMKFTPRGGTVEATLTRKGNLLCLSIEDSGSGIAEGVLQNIFSRYLRVPSLEDSRFGLGLGMVLTRSAAANHGGTVLIDSPGSGTRVTLTLAIRQSREALLRSPSLRVDYAGERDHGLLELSDVLPPALYSPES